MQLVIEREVVVFGIVVWSCGRAGLLLTTYRRTMIGYIWRVIEEIRFRGGMWEGREIQPKDRIGQWETESR